MSINFDDDIRTEIPHFITEMEDDIWVLSYDKELIPASRSKEMYHVIIKNVNHGMTPPRKSIIDLLSSEYWNYIGDNPSTYAKEGFLEKVTTNSATYKSKKDGFKDSYKNPVFAKYQGKVPEFVVKLKDGYTALMWSFNEKLEGVVIKSSTNDWYGPMNIDRSPLTSIEEIELDNDNNLAYIQAAGAWLKPKMVTTLNKVIEVKTINEEGGYYVVNIPHLKDTRVMLTVKGDSLEIMVNMESGKLLSLKSVLKGGIMLSEKHTYLPDL